MATLYPFGRIAVIELKAAVTGRAQGAETDAFLQYTPVAAAAGALRQAVRMLAAGAFRRMT